MATKYTYLINFEAGGGFEETTIYNNKLDIVHRRNADFIGIVSHFFEGSFDLLGNDFDKAVYAFKYFGFIEIQVKIGIDTVASGSAYNICDLNHKNKKCTIKNFSDGWVINNLVNYWNKEFVMPKSGTSTLYYEIGSKITDYASEVIELLDNVMESIGIVEVFDPSDYWYSTGITGVDFDDLRIAAMSYCMNEAGTEIKGGGNKSTTIFKLLKFLCEIFNITIIIENNQIYFAKHTDLIDNTLDLSAYLVNDKTRNYDPNKLFSQEIIKFSDNNNIGNDVDLVNTSIEYNYTGEILEHDVKEFTTLWKFSDELDSSGFFVGLVVSPSEVLHSANGYVSSSLKINAKLFPSNLMNVYFRDWIYTDKQWFDICGNTSSTAPSYYKHFIDIPAIEYVIADPSIFYDSILIETSTTLQRIALVTEQRTSLDSNITTFICHEFYNDID